MRNFERNIQEQDRLKETGAVLITGGCRGLGLALAFEFAKRGFDIAITGRDAEALSKASQRLQAASGVRVFTFLCDLSVPDAAHDLFDRAESAGVRVSVLVNNAGVGTVGEAWRAEDGDVLSVNVRAATELTKLYAAGMTKTGGAILNVCSVGAFQPGPYTASYYASKAYLYSYTRAVRYEMKKYDVNVSALCPGSIDTDFFKTMGSKTPKGAADPEKVAKYAVKMLFKNKETIIYPFKNRLALLVPEKIRMKFIADMKK